MEGLPGPLPRYAESQRQEDSGAKALQAVFPEERFGLRDERQLDTGVDFSVELRKDGFHLNVRAQIQLKSVLRAQPNRDGSISESVPASNLNYLLNDGGQGFYVLFVEDRGKLYYEWVSAIKASLDKEKPNWLSQDSVTIRFRNELDDKGVNDVFDTLLKHGVLSRGLLDDIAAAVGGHSRRVQLNGDQVITEDEAHRRIIEDGDALVAQSRATEALDLFGILRAPKNGDPRVLLTIAYAYCELGRYREALGHISSARLRIDELKTDHRTVLESLSDLASLELGNLSLSDFLQREESRITASTGTLAQILHLQALMRRAQFEQNRDERLERFRDGVQLADQILNGGGISEGQFRSVLRARLFAEGMALCLQVADAISNEQILAAAGFRDPNAATGDKAMATVRLFLARVDDFLAAGYMVPQFIADLLRLKILVRLQAYVAVVVRSDNSDIPHAEMLEAESDFKHARQCYEEIGSIEGVAAVTLLFAELLGLAGEDTRAKAVSEPVLQSIEAMGYRGLGEAAASFKAGTAGSTLVLQRLRAHFDRDEDLNIAEMTDLDIERMATDITKRFMLSDGRRPNVLKEVYAIRLESQERLSWCKYLHMNVGLGHLQDSATRYAASPDFGFSCSSRRISSRIPSPDARLSLVAFKEAVCKDCPLRSPKNDGA